MRTMGSQLILMEALEKACGPGQEIVIKLRDCQDVPNFLKAVKKAERKAERKAAKKEMFFSLKL